MDKTRRTASKRTTRFISVILGVYTRESWVIAIRKREREREKKTICHKRGSKDGRLGKRCHGEACLQVLVGNAGLNNDYE